MHNFDSTTIECRKKTCFHSNSPRQAKTNSLSDIWKYYVILIGFSYMLRTTPTDTSAAVIISILRKPKTNDTYYSKITVWPWKPLLNCDKSNNNRTNNVSNKNNSNKSRIQNASNDDTFSNLSENDTSAPKFKLNKSKSKRILFSGGSPEKKTNIYVNK